MYCRHCGKEIIEDSKFCRHCGFNVEDIENKQIENQPGKEESKNIDDNTLIRFETDRQLFGIKVILIMSIVNYSYAFILSLYTSYNTNSIDGVLLFLLIIIIGGSILISSLALHAYNHKKSYALPLLRAALIIFSILVLPIGLIILLIFWRRLNLPILKEYLGYEVTSREPRRKLNKKSRISLVALLSVIIISATLGFA